MLGVTKCAQSRVVCIRRMPPAMGRVSGDEIDVRLKVDRLIDGIGVGHRGLKLVRGQAQVPMNRMLGTA